MIAINTIKLQGILHGNFIDIEQFCNELNIDRNKFYYYVAHRQMPNHIYKKVSKKLGKEFTL